MKISNVYKLFIRCMPRKIEIKHHFADSLGPASSVSSAVTSFDRRNSSGRGSPSGQLE